MFGEGDEEVSGQQFAEIRKSLLERFHSKARHAFLDAYWNAVSQAQQLGFSEAARGKLLDLFLLEKAAYEVQYEAANRPRWLAIPLRGLSDVARRLNDAGRGERA